MIVHGFDWDAGNWPKCGKHGMTRAEVEEIFFSDPAVLPDCKSSVPETRFNAVGQTGSGRFAFVVFTFRRRGELHLIRPISARFMHRKEIESYERQKAAQAVSGVR